VGDGRKEREMNERGESGKAGRIISVNISRRKGTVKKPVAEAELVAGKGVAGDAHLGFAHRQVSLLMMESIEEQRKRFEELAIQSCDAIKGKKIRIEPGAFAENLTTRGIDLSSLKIGDELRINKKIRLRVSQIGKECHTHCAIYHLVGECIMPSLGIFCEVLEGGAVKPGDRIERV